MTLALWGLLGRVRLTANEVRGKTLQEFKSLRLSVEVQISTKDMSEPSRNSMPLTL